MTAPASAAPGTDTLPVAVAPTAGNSTVTTKASATVTVPYSSLTAAYNNTGISDNSDVAAGNYDGVGDSYSAQALAAGTPTHSDNATALPATTSVLTNANRKSDRPSTSA